MEITQYQDIIQKTAIYPKHLGPAYTTLGLIGELGELATAVTKGDRENVKKESGDTLWYITATCNEFGIPLQEVFVTMPKKWVTYLEDPNISINEAILISTELSEIVKKFCRDREIKLDILKIKLNHIYRQVVSIISHYGFSINEVLEANYVKLIKRRETGTLHGSGDNREELIS